MTDPYAPARIHRGTVLLLGFLALVALTGLGPYPAIPPLPGECLGASAEARIRLAGLVAAVILGTSILALRRGRRGLAFERAALALPLLLVRSKWALIMGGVALFALATEAVMGDAADGAPPSSFRLRMLAGATATTIGWLLILGIEGLTRSMDFYAVAGLALVLRPGAFLFFLGGCYEGLRATFESSDELTVPHWGSLAALASGILLYAVT